jgi:membrane-bound lytic murein transglycosylase C
MRFLYIIIFVFLMPNMAFAQANFDAMNAFDAKMKSAFDSFDENADEKFKQIDEAVSKAYSQIDEKVGSVWGDLKKMPEKKTWVGYQEDLKTRFVVDYEKGSVSVESLSDDVDKKDLQKLMDNLLDASSAELDEKDVVAKAINNAVEKVDDAKILEDKKEGISKELSSLIDKKEAAVYEEVETLGDKKVKKLSLPFLPDYEVLSAKRVEPAVFRYADKYKLPRSLVFSIIKNESAFNPRAKSHIPAFGLMQLVPKSGGYDAYTYILGKKSYPTPKYLYNPNNNIELGATYLHLLDSRYLKSFKNKRSRLYSIISGYNTGPGNVARAFVPKSRNVRKASEIVNKMTDKEVYNHLRNNLPYDETRRYLYKVTRDMKKYSHYDDI